MDIGSLGILDLDWICKRSDLEELIVILLRSYNCEVSLRIFCIVSKFSQCHTVSSIYASSGIVIEDIGEFEIISRDDYIEIFRSWFWYFCEMKVRIGS